jgi:hypothetical protein
VDTDRTTLPAPDPPRATPRSSAAAARVAAFVAVLALTAAVGWQAGRMLAAEPYHPVSVSTTAPRGS